MCEVQALYIPAKMVAADGGELYPCEHCNSVYEINPIYASTTEFMRETTIQLLFFAILSVGLTLFIIALLYPLLWLFRLALTFNKPVKLIHS